MLRLFKKTRERVVEFCERCGHVCTSACRRAALREQVRQRAFVNGARFL